ncbi:Spore germination B3/ GerAC like, C-terminal [Paenibacillus sp. UNCCL117]|uniref:Ger(x)C family spore germination C-terminal domain-containing protein n=1 Tax=unclassified Paenibacillus TaxID=185978 RepID=UPI00088FB7BD|nr:MULTISPECIES: Ger(x)C family spore germination C-terminal domain-containing protein [unclassified Paenibacillus]SDD26313.1 Spore germination B3/ GerAC like, C-terminal [Paenibacillus sp. cl123]SFW41115.1 Spore germination B3/ GerAC like, C-terminal [Paenibacillus sp. UNCCL117]
MHGKPSSRRKGLTVGLLLMSLGCAGCAAGEMEESSYRISQAAPGGANLAIAGIDEGAGGIRVTALRGPSERAGGGLKPLAAAGVETRSFVSLSDASLPWRSTQPPQLVVISERWVARHGFPSSWVAELRRLGLRTGSQPRIAAVEGTAESFVRRPDAAQLGRYVMGGHTAVRDSLREMRTEYEADQALPLFPSGLSARSDGGFAPVSIQMLLFKKQELVGRLSAEESRLFACLRGGRELADPLAFAGPDGGPAELQGVVCRTGVAWNGDWKRPLMKVSLRMSGYPAASAGAPDKQMVVRYEERLKAQVISLIRHLQQLGVDPLEWGESARAQFPGYWSADRWRGSWKRADVQVNVDVHIPGGV